MSIFNNINCQNSIKNYIKITDEKYKMVCSKALLGSFFKKISIDGSSAFSEKIIHTFLNISKIAPGKELLQRVINCGQVIRIKEEIASSDEDNPFYQAGCKTYPFLKLLIFRFDETHFHVTINKSGDKEVFEAPIESILAHEFMHLIHHFENPTSGDVIYSTKTLVHPDFQVLFLAEKLLPARDH
ncbi:MAG: hypothetical protein H0W50_00875 [Parachlamydiaceae bacterium]|nr:hypothetical protein [Parachlamydiaceae bacterium]